MKRVIWTELDPPAQERTLARPALSAGDRVRADVEAIVSRVRSGGDAAVLALTRELDGVDLSRLRVAPEEFARARMRLTPEQRRAMTRAHQTLERFHRKQIPVPLRVETAPGVVCERVHRPVERVALYVPAGSAPLPSTALMLGVPSQIAGPSRRILCTPPGSDGGVDAAVLVAAELCGVDEVYAVGGAQAVAACAYGTETIPAVDKIFGPGNAWVTEAKRQVAADPAGAALDLPAGPSEVLVVADEFADPVFVAADLLSQAEHGPDSQVLLVTPSSRLIAAVEDAVRDQLAKLTRRTIAAAALEHARLIQVESLAEAFAVGNRYAPEHLILQVDEPRRWLDRVRHAGSVFLGRYTPESLGDYVSGTNHVLPTYGAARVSGGVSVESFLKPMTIQEATEDGLADLGPVAEILADLEGLDGHRRAVSLRLDSLRVSRS